MILVLTQKCKKVTLSFVGYFFVPCPLGGLKSVPGDVFRHAELINTFTGIFLRGPKIDFFLRGGTGNFAKNDQILKNFRVCIFLSVKSLWT